MKNAIVLAALLCGAAFGQSKKPKPVDNFHPHGCETAQVFCDAQIFSSSWSSFSAQTIGAVGVVTPRSIREYAVERIKAYDAYSASHDYISPHEYWSFQSASGYGRATFSVSADGTVHLENMSMEEAVLFLYGVDLNRRLEERQKYDRELAVIADAPPQTMLAPTGKYSVSNVPSWDKSIAGDTNCRHRQIRLVNSYWAKRVTALHELMHVATNCTFDPRTHAFITALAPKLLRLLRDNPEFSEWLLLDPTNSQKGTPQ